MNSEQLAAIERLKQVLNDNTISIDYEGTLHEALPLIEALQQSLSEAQADARVFSGSYSALAEDFGRLKEENERLRDLLKDACTDLGRMTLLRDKFYCEMETAQTETVFAKKEIERLRAGITVAAFAESGAKNADSVREMIGAVNSIEKSLKEAQAERDALQARIDGALMPLKSVAVVARHWAKYSGSADKSDLGCVVVKAIEILTGEGE